jgi:RNA polymerase sigma-70 factor, ECF subfamily
MYDKRGRKPMPGIATEAQTALDVEQAFEQYHAMVFRAAYRIAGNASDAEDVLQTVFLRLVRRTGESAAVEHISSYLHRAAVNAALDLMRSRQAAPSVPLEEMPLPSSQPAPDREAASGEIREWLRKTVARLSPRAAEIFALRFYEGKENSEIARIIGASEGTVAVTLSRTRDRIQKEYEAFTGGSHVPRR